MISSQAIGTKFEKTTEAFFTWIFKEIGFIQTKARIQKGGTQNGFDVQVIVHDKFQEHQIYIECKNYKTDLDIGAILKKCMDLDKNYKLEEKDLFLAINPKAKFSNEDNSEKLAPILNEKFKFKTYLLDTTNNVRSLFALHPEFYEEIYGEEINFTVNNKEEIDRFKNIIFSRKPFKKVYLNENDIEKFIPELGPLENYLTRHYSTEEYFSLGPSPEENFSPTLLELIHRHNHLMILGSPGAGKTTEFKQLALKLWKLGLQEGITPIFRNLRRFTTNTQLDSYLPSNWKDLQNVILILDGVDEIAQIDHFISELELFIQSCKELATNVKILISSRTNIFAKYDLEIPGFDNYFLQDLSLAESKKLLGSMGEILENQSLSQDLLEFLKNPFQVEILKSYLERNRILPTALNHLWTEYIDQRLSYDEKVKLKKASFSSVSTKRNSQKISLLNELMRKTLISEDHVYEFLQFDQEQFREFLKNPLIGRNVTTRELFFEHRSIQEYFAAQSLARKPITQIIDLITIKNSSKTHPSLLNTIGFLFNFLLDNRERHDEFVSWISNIEPEILFKADQVFIPHEIKNRVFQSFFQKVCIEKRLWITTDKTYSIEEISLFSDTAENFDYLKKIITTRAEPRILISAIAVLAHFNLNLAEISSLKNHFLKLLNTERIEANVKDEILAFFRRKKVYDNEKDLLKKVLDIFVHESHNAINKRLLEIILEKKVIDENFSYLKLEFLREYNIIERENTDGVHRGNRLLLQEMFLRLSDFENFFEIIQLFLGHPFLKIDNYFSNQIISKLSYYITNADENLFRLLDALEDPNFGFNREILIKAISKSNKDSEAILHLWEQRNFNAIKRFIADLLSYETIPLLIELIKKSEPSEITKFKDFTFTIFSRKGFDLALQFQQESESKGIIVESIEHYNRELINQRQTQQIEKNLQSLFNKEQLVKEVKEIFRTPQTLLGFADLIELETAWFHENNQMNLLPPAFPIISNFISQKEGRNVSEEEVVHHIFSDENLQFLELKKELKKYQETLQNFSLNHEFQMKIKEWTLQNAEKIDFQNVLYVSPDQKTFQYSEDFERFESIIFFWQEFNVKLGKDFLLKAIQFIDILFLNKPESGLELISKAIDNIQLVDTTVIENIRNRNLFITPLTSHVEYAIERKLRETFEFIADHFKEENLMNIREKQLETFEVQYNNSYFLFECCQNISLSICWTALNLLLKQGRDLDFCYNKSISYLESGHESFRLNALNILVKLNHINAIEYILQYIKEGWSSGLSYISLSKYNAVNDYEILKSFFEEIFSQDDDMTAHYGKAFFSDYIANLSQTSSGHQNVQNQLQEIKKNLASLNKETFYINLFIDQSDNAYFNSLSNPLDFNEAKELVKNFME